MSPSGCRGPQKGKEGNSCNMRISNNNNKKKKISFFLAQSWVLHSSVQGSPSEAIRETYASWVKLAPNWGYLSENALEVENLSDFS